MPGQALLCLLPDQHQHSAPALHASSAGQQPNSTRSTTHTIAWAPHADVTEHVALQHRPVPGTLKTTHSSQPCVRPRLCKALLEVVAEHVRLVAQHRERDVVAHAKRGLNARLRHALHHHLRILGAHAVGGLHARVVMRARVC